MIVVGLTGSIAMGKSTAARMIRSMGIPVHDADAVVHRLMAPGGSAVAAIDAAFPGAVQGGAIDRVALGDRVFRDRAELKRLEAILHPMVRRAQRQFLMRHRDRPIVVLDVPLLFESGGAAACDAVLVVSAPPSLQRLRALSRPGMTAAKLAGILAKQLPDAEKRRRATHVIPTGLGLAVTWRALRHALFSGTYRGIRRKRPLWVDDARNRAGHRNHRPRSRRRPSRG